MNTVKSKSVTKNVLFLNSRNAFVFGMCIAFGLSSANHYVYTPTNCHNDLSALRGDMFNVGTDFRKSAKNQLAKK